MSVFGIVISVVIWYVGWLLQGLDEGEIFARDKAAAVFKWGSLLSLVEYATGIPYQWLFFPYLGLFIVGILVAHYWIEHVARRTTPPAPPGE